MPNFSNIHRLIEKKKQIKNITGEKYNGLPQYHVGGYN